MMGIQIIFQNKIPHLIVSSYGHFGPDVLREKAYGNLIAAKKVQAHLLTGSTEDCVF